MTAKKFLVQVMAVVALLGVVAAPVSAHAFEPQSQKESNQRQKKKNEWRNLSIGAGIAAIYGLLKGDKTLAALGTAGALYSAHRYEQDRKSQSRTDRARASLFSRTSIVKDGKRYVRKTKWKNGKKYYYFARAR